MNNKICAQALFTSILFFFKETIKNVMHDLSNGNYDEHMPRPLNQ